VVLPHCSDPFSRSRLDDMHEPRPPQTGSFLLEPIHHLVHCPHVPGCTDYLLAYAQLGENFTFQLAKPTRLVKIGLYRYVQHPSYAPLFLMTNAICLFMMQLDGVAACVLPSALVRVPWLSHVGGIATSSIVLTSMSIRVRDEEQMLLKEFGEEWEAYHRKTKRFIPGAF